MKFLPKIRKALAVLMLGAFLAIFIRFDSFGQFSASMVKMQFLPALLAHPIFWMAILAVIFLTLLTGRTYCSLICPFGLIQDALARISLKSDKGPGLMKSRPLLHFILAGIIIGSALAGFMSLIIMTEPFALSGRIMTNIIQPVASKIFLFTGSLVEGSSWFSRARINPVASEVFYTGLVLLLIFLLIVRKYGRIFCNTVCPTGAMLRIIARFSYLGIDLDQTNCTGCGICEKVCKSGCIDIKNQSVDNSRCVSCFNCLSACKFAAIHYRRKAPLSPAKESFSPERRALLGGVVSAAVAGLIPIKLKGAENSPAILPPGAGNPVDFSSRCIACHLCLTACPSAIIVAKPPEFFKESSIQPSLNFDRGMCEQTCNLCTQVCPTGAIKPVSLEEKKTLKIAEVEYFKDLCVVETDDKDCGACAEHCPTKAVRMVPYRDNLMIPEITPDICIGCGSCEHICPVRPKKAIVVNPVSAQTHIVLPEPEPIKDAGPVEEFPF
jgi:ferredoxin